MRSTFSYTSKWTPVCKLNLMEDTWTPEVQFPEVQISRVQHTEGRFMCACRKAEVASHATHWLINQTVTCLWAPASLRLGPAELSVCAPTLFPYYSPNNPPHV